ncbi:hypothetical protein Dip510_000854 [Elusimicrobium posterum]
MEKWQKIMEGNRLMQTRREKIIGSALLALTYVLVFFAGIYAAGKI